MRRYLVWFCLMFVLPLTQNVYAQQPMQLPVHSVPITVEASSGSRQFFIEVALTPQEHSNGLMFRTNMPDNRGMLFVFKESAPRSFWMKNTPLPLDLIFIGEDGIIRAIAHGVPFSEESIAPPVMAQFVLELKDGTTEKAGISVGDKFHHPLIDKITDGK